MGPGRAREGPSLRVQGKYQSLKVSKFHGLRAVFLLVILMNHKKFYGDWKGSRGGQKSFVEDPVLLIRAEFFKY